jgi:hypothetical protein
MFSFDTKVKNLTDPSTINQPTNNLESIKPGKKKPRNRNSILEFNKGPKFTKIRIKKLKNLTEPTD